MQEASLGRESVVCSPVLEESDPGVGVFSTLCALKVVQLESCLTEGVSFYTE